MRFLCLLGVSSTVCISDYSIKGLYFSIYLISSFYVRAISSIYISNFVGNPLVFHVFFSNVSWLHYIHEYVNKIIGMFDYSVKILCLSTNLNPSLLI